jgi:transcriptional regulator with XRE-family HTH domain
MTFNYIDYISNNKGISQKELAEKLGVSTAQISKWKKGEKIPEDRQEQLHKIADIWSLWPTWVELVQTKENQTEWFETFDNEFTTPENAEEYLPSLITNLIDLGFTFSSNVHDSKAFFKSFMHTHSIHLNWLYTNMIEDVEHLTDIAEQAYRIEETLHCITLEEMLNESEGQALITELFEKPLESLTARIQAERLEALNLIANYCSLRSKYNMIHKDYFHLVFVHSEELLDSLEDEDFLSNYAIDKYLSFAERLTLKHLSEQTRIMQKFEAKFDELFSQDNTEAKKRFLDAMENTVLTK